VSSAPSASSEVQPEADLASSITTFWYHFRSDSHSRPVFRSILMLSSQDWSKYGKPYTGALASSFTTVTGPNTNPSTQAATNFQRPLPDLRPPTNTGPGPGPGQGINGGGWKQHPGNHPPPSMQSPYRPPSHFGGPPPPPPHGFGFGGGGGMAPQINVQHNYGGYVPPGAIRVGPGDPRIGGV
jgi:hypothetical protein